MPLNNEFVKQLIGGPADFGIGWIVILISSAITIFIGILNFLKWSTRERTKKNALLEKLSSLAIGTNIDYFKTLLGNPVFINTVAYHQEYIFVNPYFYVQALVNMGDTKIALFSVTTRKKKFNPTLKIGYMSQYVVELGKTTFAELNGQLKKIIKRGGDHGGFDFYSELYYLGFDGHYLTYGFSVNENGYGQFVNIPESFLIDVPEDPAAIKKFRAENIVNTYTIVGSFREEEIGKSIELGPWHSQVRVLKSDEPTVY